jgi:ATP-dependent Zn protease
MGSPWALPCFSTTRKTTRASFIKDPLKFDGRTDGFVALHGKTPRRVCKGRTHQKSVWTTSVNIITEGAVEFPLGTLKGNEVNYDFEKTLVYLNAKSKMLFGKKFKIYREDREILYKLCLYFIQDKARCSQMGIDCNKGILLSGPVGCGKTSLMKLMKYIKLNVYN